jgi:MoxR-like ATPase
VDVAAVGREARVQVGEVAAELGELRRWLEGVFLERREVVEGLMTALGAGQHVLLVGPAGTAKSDLLGNFAQALGLRFFHAELYSFSTPEDVFGPLDMRGLMEGRYERVVEGSLLEAEVALLDEVYNASSAVLRGLHGVMNERRYRHGAWSVEVPLRMLVGATNQLPQGQRAQDLAAFHDRFLFRYVVDYLGEPGDAARMLSQLTRPTLPVLGRKVVDAYQALARQVPWTEELSEVLVRIRTLLREEGVVVSDRRLVWSREAIRAHAVLSGALEVEVARDFPILAHTLWTVPEERAQVAKAVYHVADPLGEEVRELGEEEAELVSGALGADEKEKTARGTEALAKLKKLRKRLEEIRQQGSVATREAAEELERKIASDREEVMRTCLGVDLKDL